MVEAAAGLAERRALRIGAGPLLNVGSVKGCDRILVSDTSGGALAILDGSTTDLIASVDVGGGPRHFVVDNFTDCAYVAIADADVVAVVDARSATLKATVPLPTDCRPTVLVPGFNRYRLYALNHGIGSVTEIDSQSNQALATLAIGAQPAFGQPHNESSRDAATIAPGPEKLHIACAGSDEVAILDEAPFQVRRHVKVGTRPWRVAVSLGRDQRYVLNAGSGSISVIDLATDSLVQTVAVDPAPLRLLGVKQWTGRDEIWVLNQGEPNGSIAVLDSTTLARKQTIPVCDSPAHWLINTRTRQIYVTSGTQPVLCVVDLASSTVTACMSLSQQPQTDAVSNSAFSRSGDNLFVATTSGDVLVISTL